MLKVTVNTKDVQKFARQLSISGTKAERITEEAAPIVGRVITEMIMGKMAELAANDGKDGRFWTFMAARTGINVDWAGGTVIVTIQGLPEGEVPDAAESRSGEGTPDANTNLWNLQEFGGVIPSQTGYMKFKKDDGSGKIVRTKSVGDRVITKRKGSVKRLIESLRVQIQTSAHIIAAIQGHSAVAGAIESAAPKRNIKIDKRARTALKRAGVGEAELSVLGVSRVIVNPSGQISLLGRNENGSMRFKGGKDFGIPTTIRRR